MSNITIIGAGGWGLALANIFSERHHVKVWVHSRHNYELLSTTYKNNNYLKDLELNKSIIFYNNIEESIEDSEIILIVTPSFAFADTCISLKPFLKSNQIIVSATKGIDRKTGYTMSELYRSIISEDFYNILTLSGPSHAEEVARGIHTALVVGGDESISEYVRDVLSILPKLRIYNSTDQKGVEIGGALKNIIAVASGIIDGLNLGDNIKAALVTRGLHEIVRFAVNKGAKAETIYGLSGMGDLIVTCFSGLSRNNRLGREISNGKNYEDFMKENNGQVAEGIYVTISTYEYSKKNNIYMPITEAIYNILFNNVNIIDTLNDLMSKNTKNEVR